MNVFVLQCLIYCFLSTFIVLKHVVDLNVRTKLNHLLSDVHFTFDGLNIIFVLFILTICLMLAKKFFFFQFCCRTRRKTSSTSTRWSARSTRSQKNFKSNQNIFSLSNTWSVCPQIELNQIYNYLY